MESLKTEAKKTVNLDKLKQLRRRILMCCGNGYSFSEYFKPLIEELSGSFDVELLQVDYHLSQATRASLNDLVSQGKVCYRLIPVFGFNSSFRHYQTINKLITALRNKPFDLLVVTTDSNLLERYLINLARSLGAKIVVIYASALFIKLLETYRKNIGVGSEPLFKRYKNRLVGQKSLKERIALIWASFFRRICLAGSGVIKYLKVVKGYYIFPFIFSGKVFLRNKYEWFSFACGRADTVICYNAMEAEAVRNVISTAKDVRLARHPAVYYSSVLKNNSSRKLLVLFRIGVEKIRDDQIDFWIRAIAKAEEVVGLDEVHLRFHPRTDRNLPGAKKLIDTISSLSLKLVIADTDKVSLPESLSGCSGVIGALSGSLRTACCVCRGFVVGLLDACGEFPDRYWMLGDPEGINWVRNGQELEDKHFYRAPLTEEDRPKVSEILREIA